MNRPTASASPGASSAAPALDAHVELVRPTAGPDARDTLLANARRLQPVLRARAADAIAARCIPRETIADFHAAGFWRMLQPQRWGGLEVHPNTFFEVQQLIGAACPSSAWVLGVVAVHNWQLALFDDQAQQDVWADDPTVLVSSSYAPTGKVVAVDGGYELTGRWSFSSGVAHCGWTFLGGFAPTAEGEPPDMRTFLVPREDYEVEDVWHTIALRATGSNDVILDRVFVPEHRTHKMTDGFRCKSPGNKANTAPLYRLPFGQVFTRSVSTTALGITQGALDFYREVTATKVGAADGGKAAQNPFAQLAVARASSTLDQLRLVLQRNFHEMMALAEAGERGSIEQRVAWRWDSSEAVSKCVEVVDELFGLCGGRALFTNSPMHQFFLDVHGARAHYANRPESAGTNFGRVALGLGTRDWFI